MKYRLLTLLLAICSLTTLYAQTDNNQLFDYPVVPDTISTFENRSNYYIAHFWDNCNLSKPITDDAKLHDAMLDYIIFFQYANKNVVRSSVNELMNKAQSNIKNFWKIAECAEALLYAPGTQYQSDEAYMFFVNNIMRSSRVKKNEKERYKQQIDRINHNQIGVVAQDFEYKDADGNTKSFYDLNCETYILMFVNDDNTDSSIAKLRLSTNVAVNELIKNEKLMIVCVYNQSYSKEWGESVKASTPNWINAAFPGADSVYDLRTSPAVYVLDNEKKILNKNISVDSIIAAIEQ